jgi:glycosyltransferase involved in cell wall biosynthesis
MIKFSIIVPVWNVEKYIDKCLKSIESQSYKNFEVIIINDGSPDNSQDIIDKYVKRDKRFKSFIKENGGLSDARNYGVKHACGEYLMFIDSDDYIEKDLLSEIGKVYKEKGIIDIVKFQANKVFFNSEEIKKISGSSFDLSTPENIFKQTIKEELFEPIPFYSFNLNFWKKNKFEFAKGKCHEDFGLMPLILIRAKRLISIPYYGYNYIIRKNSITTSTSEAKIMSNLKDILFHYDNLIKVIDKERINDKTKVLFKSFLANGIINKSKNLNSNVLKFYIKELQNRNVVNNLLADNFKRKIKKILIKLNLKFYIKRILK